ncbi:hypothetical protein GOP47_0019190 [Adiantum capillus-veneris]|uniref:Pentatricopeptide repeat-containing protein n=1 Tax=Adiantum capillus-veneris TaxID=13818 RepID=A0A9D4ZBE4_ADICA|nr:hypothetical protein GOP47_0019190 [Adiantum capillus-veneris]
MIEGVFYTSKSELCSILQECIAKKDLTLGRGVHSLLIGYGYESKNTYSSRLIRLYTALGHFQEATVAFSQVPRPNLCSWSAIVAGYARIGDAPTTLELYQKMQQCGVRPNSEVFLCMLKVCSSQGFISIPDATELLRRQGIPLSNNILISLLQGCLKARSLSACRHLLELIKSKGLESVALFGNQLIRVFALCGSLEEAKHVFEMIVNPNTHTWNAIISAHVSLGESEHAVCMFSRMQQEGTVPNEFIFTCTLKACSTMEAVELGRLVHHQIVVCQLESNISIGNALVDVYSKDVDVEDASKVFDNLEHPDIVSWGSMIICFSQHGHDFSAVELYDRMEEEGITPNRPIFLHVLRACGNIGALGHGRLLHVQLLRHGLQSDGLIGSVLIHMYAACGNIEDLRAVFERLPARNVISWGAMISGHVQQGDYQSAVCYLEDMLQEGMKPDTVIFTAILTACTHAGLIDVGIQHFKVMTEKCGLSPTLTHYNCLIDLYARMGLLDEAKALLHTIPELPDIIGWKAILTSCRTHRNTKLGTQCLDASVQIDPHDSAGYILMSNIYTDIDL